MFPCSPQEEIIVELIKNDPVQKFTYMLLAEWSTAVFVCLVIVVHESLVCPELLNILLFFRKILQVHILGFPAFLFIWTLSNNGCMILRSIFSHRGQPRDLFTTITEDSNTHWCSRRRNHALRAEAWKLLNRMKMCMFFLFCLNIIFFSFSTALQKLQKIVTCFPEDKLNWPWSSNSKSFPERACSRDSHACHAMTPPPPCFTDEAVSLGSFTVPFFLHIVSFPSLR